MQGSPLFPRIYTSTKIGIQFYVVEKSPEAGPGGIASKCELRKSMDCPDKACTHALSGQSMDCLLNPRIEKMKCYKYGFGQSHGLCRVRMDL